MHTRKPNKDTLECGIDEDTDDGGVPRYETIYEFAHYEIELYISTFKESSPRIPTQGSDENANHAN